jgi:predicted Zn-dependent protease
MKGPVAAAETRQRMAEVLITVAEVAREVTTGIGGVTSSARNLGAQAALAHFDRAQEIEADRIALEIVAAAGYDPRLALSTLERGKAVKAKYGSGPTFAASHPDAEAREEKIREWLEAHDGQDYSKALVTTQEFFAIRSRYRTNP